jgi:hypothetical protein
MRRLLVLLALSVACGLAASGCGGEEITKEQYVDEAAAPLGEVDAALSALGSSSPDDLASEAARAQAALLAAAATLEQIDAPAELRAAHDLLVEGVRELAGGLDGILTGPAGDVASTVDRIESLPALEKLDRARERFSQEDVTLEFGQPAPAGP